jgi:2-keto-3-deoxy-L-rhamnonate aldolase RhmA
MNPGEEAPHLWQNPVKKALHQGKVVLGTFVVQWPYPSTIKILHDAGFDFIILDMEHSAPSWETIANALFVPLESPVWCEYHKLSGPGLEGL